MDADRRAQVIAAAERHARAAMAGDAGGHEWWHVHRVRTVALRLAAEEGADPFVVEVAALLHDVGDHKLTGSYETAPELARRFCAAQGVDGARTEAVAAIVGAVSFRGGGHPEPLTTVEGDCVIDADRLDAMGAIGIARAFAFGGSRGHPIWDPDETVDTGLTQERYLGRTTSAIGHFHEKLLMLRDRMRTPTGRRVAERRHRVMTGFLEEFHREWEAGDIPLPRGPGSP